MQYHRQEELLLLPFEAEAVLFELQPDFLMSEKSPCAGVLFDLLLRVKQSRRDYVYTLTGRIVNDHGGLRDAADLLHQSRPSLAVREHAECDYYLKRFVGEGEFNHITDLEGAFSGINESCNSLAAGL